LASVVTLVSWPAGFLPSLWTEESPSATKHWTVKVRNCP
jgi:hypothetical protein